MAPVGTPKGGLTIEQSLEKLSKKTVPYTDDIFMFNFAWKGEEAWKTGIYSPHKAKQVAWSRHFTGFWNESMAFCEMFLPELEGDSPEKEMLYYKAVTGKKDSFEDTMRIGQKIWTLERAIRVMHGRSRQAEDFFPYMYKPGASGMAIYGGVPIYENGKMASRLSQGHVSGPQGRGRFQNPFLCPGRLGQRTRLADTKNAGRLRLEKSGGRA